MNTKKVLFIDATLHKRNATGITLSNLFGSWPKDNLFMMGTHEMIAFSRIEGYYNTYVIDDKDYYHRFPLGLLLHLWKLFKNNNLKKKSKGNPEIKSVDSKSEKLSNKFFIRTLALYFFQRLGLDHLFFRQIISADLREWVEKSKPDYLYAVLSTRHSILFAEKLVVEFKIPLIIHIMDDWPTTIGRESFFYKFWNNRINIEFERFLKLTHTRVAISELMAIEYTRKYNLPWEYFHNPVDLAVWAGHAFQKEKERHAFTILYSGRLSDGMTDTIKLVSESVDDINRARGSKIVFRIQSKCKPDWIDDYSCIVFSEYIDYKYLPELFSSVDLLLLPYDFYGYSYKFIRLSMPTKITEYMASGTPILVIAPNDSAISHLTAKWDFSFLLNFNEKYYITEAILQIQSDKDLRLKYSRKAFSLVEGKFEIKKIQSEFNELFK